MSFSPRLSPFRLAVLTTAVATTYVLLPLGGLGRSLVYGTVAVTLAALCWVGLARLPTGARGPWPLATLGVSVGVVADISTDILFHTATQPAFPTPLHLLYPLSHLLLAVAVIGMVRRGRRQDQASLLDALIVATSVGALVWLGLAGPAWASLGGTMVGRLQVVLYPAANLLLLISLVRLALAVRRGSPAIAVVVGFASTHLCVAIVTALLINLDRYTPGTVLAMGWLASYGLIALAMRQNGAERLPLQRDEQRALVAPRRTALLIPATLLLPVTMLLVPASATSLLLAGAATVLLLLIGARVGLLLREVQEGRDHDLAAQAQRDHRRFEAVVRHAADILLVVEPTGEVAYASPSARALYGDDPTGWMIRRLAEYVHEDERAAMIAEFIERIERSQGQPVRMNTRLLDDGVREQHIELVAVDLRDDPDVGGTVITLRDTSERAALEQQLRHLAFHDPLTGLGNREMFRERLDQAIARAQRKDEHLALLMCDLDDFKDVNDTLGHGVGDRLLIEVSRRLSSVTRTGDSVVRLGGDEFAILCEDVASTRDAVMTARRLLDATREAMTVDAHRLRVGMSIGVVVDSGARSADELLRDADVALYSAKEQGKNRISLHRATMTVQARARLRLAEDLQRAIEDHDLDVAFQPIYELATDRLVAVEALARWNHPQRGMVSPAEFVRVAEQSGLIPGLGAVVLDRTLAALGRWRDARPGLELSVAVNLSARELREPDIVSRVVGRLQQNAIPPSHLLLELTETGMLEDEQLALNVMHRLRDHGVRFAVDDFGTGYSSLSYLRRLPVDTVKIDRSFIEELGVDDAADDLVRAIVELSRTLHLNVVAEGIETLEQRGILEAMRCTLAQGFLLGRPMGEAAIQQLLNAPGEQTIGVPPRPAEEAPPASTLAGT